MAETRQTEEEAELSRRQREARREIRVIGDPVLRERAAEVEVFDRGLRKLAKKMIRIMHDAPGVGLAAPQIGVLQRVLVYEVEDEPHALVNPVLDGFSEETEESDEGCLSLPGVTMPVSRSLSVHVRARDTDGGELDYVAEGLEARVIQHEFDHLEGILIVDRTSRSARAEAMRALRDRDGVLGAVGGGL